MQYLYTGYYFLTFEAVNDGAVKVIFVNVVCRLCELTGFFGVFGMVADWL